MAMPSPLCSIIIPVFNKWELTKACLESLQQHTASIPYEVLVVDNGSSDETATALKSVGSTLFGTTFKHIRFDENKNFAAGCNAGAQAATADMLFFLNNDTLLTPGWFTPLFHSFSQNPHQGAAGPLLLYPNNTVQHLGVTVYPRGITHLYQDFPENHPVVFRQRPLQALTAAALMVPKQLFFQAGAFHEGYRNGFEDLELSLRIRQQQKTLHCIPASRVYHLESQSSGRHMHTHYNQTLLQTRCPNAFTIDAHHHAFIDGFSVYMTDLLDFSVQLTPQESTALLSDCACNTPQVLYSLINAHPNWLEGMDLLATTLERNGNFSEACSLRSAIANLASNKKEVKKLLLCAAKAGLEDLKDEALSLLERITLLQQDEQQQRALCTAHILQAKQINDTVLESMYTQALHSIAAMQRPTLT